MRQLLNSKKGNEASETAFHYVFVFIFLTLIISLYVLLFSMDMGTKHKIPPDLEEHLMMTRFINYPGCFAYEDSNGRIYPGIFDYDKISEETFNNCYYAKQRNYALQFTLSFKGETHVFQTEKFRLGEPSTDVFYYNALIKEEPNLVYYGANLTVKYHPTYS